MIALTFLLFLVVVGLCWALANLQFGKVPSELSTKEEILLGIAYSPLRTWIFRVVVFGLAFLAASQLPWK